MNTKTSLLSILRSNFIFIDFIKWSSVGFFITVISYNFRDSLLLKNIFELVIGIGWLMVINTFLIIILAIFALWSTGRKKHLSAGDFENFIGFVISKFQRLFSIFCGISVFTLIFWVSIASYNALKISIVALFLSSLFFIMWLLLLSITDLIIKKA